MTKNYANLSKTRVFATKKYVVRSIDILSELTMYKYSSAINKLYIYAMMHIAIRSVCHAGRETL